MLESISRTGPQDQHDFADKEVVRVILVTYDYKETGGQGRFSRGLVSALRDRNVEIEVISPETADSDRVLKAAARFGKNAGFSFPVNLRLRSLLESRGADLVHVNGGPGGVFVPLRQPVPVVYTAHHTYAQQARLVGGQGWKRLLAYAEEFSYRRATSIAADTQSTADSLIREYRLSPKKVNLIPCGLDFETFQPTKGKKIPGSCLFVGRFDSRKGLPHLLEAWAMVVKTQPGSRLSVIGDGPESSAALKRIAQLGIQDSVRFLGRVSTEELVRLYSEAQCVAVPSVFEGFGLAALEALACGTRVVARNVEGLRDVVNRPELGSLVAADDSIAFAEAIVKEFDEPQSVDGETRAWLAEQYGWQQIAARYVSLYEAGLQAASTDARLARHQTIPLHR